MDALLHGAWPISRSKGNNDLMGHKPPHECKCPEHDGCADRSKPTPHGFQFGMCMTLECLERLEKSGHRSEGQAHCHFIVHLAALEISADLRDQSTHIRLAYRLWHSIPLSSETLGRYAGFLKSAAMFSFVFAARLAIIAANASVEKAPT